MKKIAIALSFPVFLLAARFVPFGSLPSTCIFLHLTGYPCPTCGMTRSIMSLTRFDFEEAVYYNNLGPAFAGLLALCWAAMLYETVSGRHSRLTAWARRNVVLLILIGFGILVLNGGIRIWLLGG